MINESMNAITNNHLILTLLQLKYIEDREPMMYM